MASTNFQSPHGTSEGKSIASDRDSSEEKLSLAVSDRLVGKVVLSEAEYRNLKHKVVLYQSENEGRRQLANRFGPDWEQNPAFQDIGDLLSQNCHNCPTFQELERSEAENSQLKEEKVSLIKENQELRLELGKPRANSGNSGISPSKDPPGARKGKKDKDKPSEKKPRGGKKGHLGHFRQPFSDEEIDEIVPHEFKDGESICPDCGTELIKDSELNEENCQCEMPKVRVIRKKHIIFGYKCPNCGKIHHPPVTAEIKRGMLLSPSLLVRLVLMKNLFTLSMDKIRRYFAITLDLNISVSYVAKCLKTVGLGARAVYLEAQDAIKTERNLNIDETVAPSDGKILYAWAFIGAILAVIKIATRAGSNLTEVLGDDYDGTITSDCYGVYLSYVKNHEKADLQLCLFHLRQDFKRCADFIANKEVREFGENGVQIVKNIFEVHKQYKQNLKEEGNQYGPESLKCLGRLRDLADKLISLCVNAPTSYSKSKAIGERFKNYPGYYFLFISNPDVDPSNNRAERMIRSIVVERKNSYGTKGLIGNMICESLWTIRETLKLQGRDLESYYTELITAIVGNKPLPSLVNPGKPVAQKYVEQAKLERKKLNALSKALARSKEANEAKKEFENPLGRSEESLEAKPEDHQSVTQKPKPPVSEGKPKPKPLVSEERPKPEPSALEVKPKPEPSVLEVKPKPEPSVLEVKPKPEPPSSNKMRKTSAEIIDKEGQKTADNTPAPFAPNPSSKAGKHLKRPTTNHPAKTGREPHQPPPLVIAPGSLRRESGACPKGSHSYASPKPGSSLASQEGRSALKPEINPGAKGRGASRKTLKKSPSPLSQIGIR
jgi:transposase